MDKDNNKVVSITSKKRKPPKAKTFPYLVEYLREHLEGRISRDSNTNFIRVISKLSWDDSIVAEDGHENGDIFLADDNYRYHRALEDSDILMLLKQVNEKTKLEFSKPLMVQAVEYLANLNITNPVEAHLLKTEWDGEARLENWLLNYCEAYGPSEYIIRQVSKKFLMGMVRRGMNPGTKMDYMLVLQGPQGIGKSTLCKILAGEDKFFSDELPDLFSSQKTIESYSGKLIIEIGEMANFKGANIERLKHFITRTSETARMAYAAYSKEIHRTFSMIGTTNGVGFISDSSGWRRFWPIAIKSVDLAGLRFIRDQLIAEAIYMVNHEIEPVYLNREEEDEYDLFRISRIEITSESLKDLIFDNFELFQQLAEETPEGLLIPVKRMKELINEYADEKLKLSEITNALIAYGFTKFRVENARYWVLPEKLEELYDEL